MPEPKLVCLLPARNCADELPAWFESVERFADAVVALDDGSTDDTGALLRDHPLTVSLSTNPVRQGFAGWDDAANRNQLLNQVAALAPRWVFSLDADERIDEDDAAALRAFVEATSDDHKAYLLRVYRMIGDMEHWDRADMWAGRLFRYRQGQRFPAERLHFVPIPISIPRRDWVQSTIRIQHRAGLTSVHREKRFAKYQEVDRDHRYQDSYEHLLNELTNVRPWEKRGPSLPFVMNGSAGLEVGNSASPSPSLSAIVISRDDEDRIEECVRAVSSQEVSEPFETIVVVSGTDCTADIVRERFPSVTLIALEKPALPGEARNAGLAVAQGRYVSFPGSHVVLPPGSLQARLDAHKQGYAMVTGSMFNGTDSWAGWASYLLDHSTALPGRGSSPLGIFPAHCSYRRDALQYIGGFPDIRAGEDTLVNKRLFEMGYGAFRSREIKLTHRTPARTPFRLLRHHAIRGRGLAELLLEEHAAGRLFTRPGLRSRALVWLPGRIRRIHRNVMRWGDPPLRRRFFRALPLIVLAAGVHWLAGWWGFLAASARRSLRAGLFKRHSQRRNH